MSAARYAIYLYPRYPELLRLANAWLGRDPATGEPLPQAKVERLNRREIREITALPRRYGFHATLKAPFRLAPGRTPAELAGALREFAAQRSPFRCPPLRVSTLGAFVALRPAGPCPAADRLAADCVEAFEPFRAPPTRLEREKWADRQLSPDQRRGLERWGYPYVGRSFRLHFTLTGPLPRERREEIPRRLADYFAPALALPLPVDALSLFREPAPGAPFRLIGCFPFSPSSSAQ